MREAWAVYFPGEDPDAWLKEITCWRGKHEEIELYAVSRGMDDPAAAGLLALFPEPVSGLRGLAFGKAGARFYLPVDSTLYPNVSDEELNRMFPFHVTLYHPTLGLCGFEAADGMSVGALLRPPELAEPDWGHAVPFHDINRRLVSIRLESPESFGEMFEEEAREIGSDPVKPPKSIFGRPKKKEPQPNSSGSGTGGLGGLLGGFGSWAMQKIESLRQSMEANRNRELTNLLEQLGKDPDQALRHAIPLSSNSPHRGLAAPSDRLGDRNVDFSLGRVGSGAADFWSIPYHLEVQLRAKYVALANREMQIGHYRRAAYIYAELLGDMHSAANVLKQGKHFREAAILLRDHLHNKSAAAQCFEEGGLLQDAIGLYDELGNHRDLGRVYRKMGNEAAASAAFRKAVAELTESGNRILAARILDTDLSARDEALTLLDQSWPSSNQAIASLEVYLEICRRDNLDEIVRKRLQRFRREAIPTNLFMPSLKLISTVAEFWKGTDLQRSGADLCRVLVGNALPRQTAREARELTEVIARLDPNDPQLRRDAARFADRVAADLAGKAQATTRKSSYSGKPVHASAEFKLPPDVRWKRVIASGACFYAVGELGKKTLALRGLWNGHLQQISWKRPDAQPQDYLLDVDPSHPYQVLLCGFMHEACTPNRLLPADDQFSQRFCEVGTPPWLSQAVPLAVAARGGKVAMLSLGDNSDAVLSIYNRVGDLIGTKQIPVPIGNTRPAMCMLGNAVVGGFGEILWIATEKEVTVEEMDSPIISLTASREHTRPAFIAVMARRVEARWLGSEESHMLCDDMPPPHAAFLRDGRVVLLAGKDGRIYDVNTSGIAGATRFEWTGQDPVALTHAGERSKVAVFEAEGRVQVLLV